MLLTYKDDSDGPKTYSRPRLKKKCGPRGCNHNDEKQVTIKITSKWVVYITLALLNRSLIRAEPTPTKTSTNSDPAIW